MKTFPGAIALVAMASSLATLGAIELLRRPDSTAGARAVPESSAPAEPRTVGQVESPFPSAHAEEPPVHVLELATEHVDRLAELERRIAALESASRRVPAGSAANELSPRDELRTLVLDWVAEEREARERVDELAEEEAERTEREFGVRFSAYMVAEEHGLADWQRDKLADVFLEIEVRRDELDVETMKDEPEVAEARWDEFDRWAEQRLVDELGQEIVDLIEGDDN